MFEKPDLINVEELDKGEVVESDKETLEQKEEIIELDISLEDFQLLESTHSEYRIKMDGPDGSEKFQKGYDFATELLKKYGREKMRSVALYHLLLGSSIDLDNPTITKIDIEGEDSIAKFIEEL